MYKRQGQFTEADHHSGRKDRSKHHLCAFRAVSYTHLDVYKRQGLLFGLAHITNFIFDADMTMFNKGCTMIMACGFGFTLEVIFLRTKSIGVVITLHFLWDFADRCV